MKKLIFLIGFVIVTMSVYSQTPEAILYQNQSAEDMVSDANDKWQQHTDTLKAVSDTIDFLQDSVDVHRGLIDLNFGWIYDIMNDSLTDHFDSIRAHNLRLIDLEAGGGGGGTTIATDLTGTAYRVFYTDGSGDMTELALGADGTYLKSNGATSAPTFATPAGSGDVAKVGTPANNEIAVWTGDGTIEGESLLTFDNQVLSLIAPSAVTSIALSATGTPATTSLYVTGDDFYMTSSDDINLIPSGDVVLNPTGDLVWGSATITETELEILDGATLSTTELNYVDGVTSAIQTQIDAKVDAEDGVSASSDLYLLADTIPAYTFGAGSGLEGDTALFAKDAHGFGMFNTMNDTTVCLVDLLRISDGDSLLFNIYWGNGMALTATDSLFDAVEPVGVNQGSLTVDDAKIPPNQDVWIEIKSDKLVLFTPNEVVIQLSKQIIRD